MFICHVHGQKGVVREVLMELELGICDAVLYIMNCQVSTFM